MARVNFVVNGAQHAFDGDGNTSLLDVLRDTLKLNGSRFGCGANQYGACYVLIDGAVVA